MDRPHVNNFFLNPVAASKPNLSQSRTEVEYLLNRHFYNLAMIRGDSETSSLASSRSGISQQSLNNNNEQKDTKSAVVGNLECSFSHGGSDRNFNNNQADNSATFDNSGIKKRKRNSNEDPLSHRIIEKRRRDRMNNCLADLSRLIPSSYLKKGRGRIEKTEIIEMAIKHMKHLHTHSNCRSIEKCELSATNQTVSAEGSVGTDTVSCDLGTRIISEAEMERNIESFRMGYRECLSEVMHFMVEKEGAYGGDPLCTRMVNHLQRHYEKLNKVKLCKQPNETQTTGSSYSDAPTQGSISSSSGYSTGGTGSVVGTSSVSEVKQVFTDSFSMAGGSSEVVLPKRRPSFSEPSSSSHYGDPARHYDRDSLVKMEEQTEGMKQISSPGAVIETQESSIQAKDNDMHKTRHISGSTSESCRVREDHDAQGNYKFKANLRERFSHQQPRHYQQNLDNFGSRSYLTTDLSSSDSLQTSLTEMLPFKRKKSMLEGGGVIRIKENTDEKGKDCEPRGQQRLGQNRNQSPSQHLSFTTSSNPEQGSHLSPSKRHSSKEEGHTLATSSDKAKGVPTDRPSVIRTFPPHQSGTCVPIFALHPKGSYYIPLSIDYAVIASSLVLFTSTEDNNGNSVVLHPITINVNFCGPVLGPRTAATASTSETSPCSESNVTNLQEADQHLGSRTDYRYAPRWREKLDRILSPANYKEDRKSHNSMEQEASGKL